MINERAYYQHHCHYCGVWSNMQPIEDRMLWRALNGLTDLRLLFPEIALARTRKTASFYSRWLGFALTILVCGLWPSVLSCVGGLFFVMILFVLQKAAAWEFDTLIAAASKRGTCSSEP